MSRPRLGTLSDALTLEALESGVPVMRLAHDEGVAPSTVLSRARRARRERERAEAWQADVLAGLRAAVAELEALAARQAAR